MSGNVFTNDRATRFGDQIARALLQRWAHGGTQFRSVQCCVLGRVSNGFYRAAPSCIAAPAPTSDPAFRSPVVYSRVLARMHHRWQVREVIQPVDTDGSFNCPDTGNGKAGSNRGPAGDCTPANSNNAAFAHRDGALNCQNR